MTTGTTSLPGNASPDYNPPLVAGNLVSVLEFGADTPEATDFKLENAPQSVASVFSSKADASQTLLVAADIHAPHSLADAQILLVEGNRIDQMVARKFLEKWGASVEIAGSGLEAIEKLRFASFNVVLMDLQMPTMDGYNTARHIRHRMDTPVKNIPIVALTTTDTPKVRRMAREAGINDFVAKPFDSRDLHLKMLKFAGFSSTSGATIPLSIPAVAPLAVCVGPQYVNLQYLEEISADNKAFVRDMIRLFIRQMPQFVRKLRAACETADWQAMRYLIHKMKSSLAIIGILESEPVIRQLETHASQEIHAHETIGLVWQIEEICEKAYDELHDKLAEIGFLASQV